MSKKCHFNTFRGLDFDFFFAFSEGWNWSKSKIQTPLKLQKWHFLHFQTLISRFWEFWTFQIWNFSRNQCLKNQWPRNQGGKGGNCPLSFLKLSHKNAIKHKNSSFWGHFAPLAPSAFGALRGHWTEYYEAKLGSDIMQLHISQYGLSERARESCLNGSNPLM